MILYSTVLENFSGKPRNTVSVREGQAVVLLCGPPLHYGGTLFYSGSSALVTISCLSQQSLLFLTLLPLFPLHSPFCFPACPPPFAALPLELASTIFLTLHLHCGQKINTSFLSFFFLFARTVMSTLTLPNLKITLLTCLICVHPASIKSPTP